MNCSTGLLRIMRPRTAPVSSASAICRSTILQQLQHQNRPTPVSTTLSTTFVRSFRVKPKRNKNRPPRQTAFKGRLEQMNFQCYQLAMDIIRKDRAEKAEQIAEQIKRVNRIKSYLKEKPDDRHLKIRLFSSRKHLERLRVLHDINSPRVRYLYMEGKGSMDRPVNRHLARKEFQKMRQKILNQRIQQHYLVPDIVHNFDPQVDVRVRFRGKEVEPGAFVRSRFSQAAPTVKVIPFETKNRLCTIAIIDPDVPDIERDSYTYRLHWLVSNIEINHLQTQAIGFGSKGATTLSPYFPPHVHRGAPYHRYCLIVFDQEGRIEKPETEIVRDGFNMRSFMGKNGLSPITAFIFRGKWDKYTKELMQKNEIEGWNLRFVRKMM